MKYQTLDQVKEHVDGFFNALNTVQDVIGFSEFTEEADNRIIAYRVIRHYVPWAEDVKDLRNALLATAVKNKPEVAKLLTRWVHNNLE